MKRVFVLLACLLGAAALARTGEHPAMGEVLVLQPQPGGFRVAGRLAVP